MKEQKDAIRSKIRKLKGMTIEAKSGDRAIRNSFGSTDLQNEAKKSRDQALENIQDEVDRDEQQLSVGKREKRIQAEKNLRQMIEENGGYMKPPEGDPEEGPDTEEDVPMTMDSKDLEMDDQWHELRKKYINKVQGK